MHTFGGWARLVSPDPSSAASLSDARLAELDDKDCLDRPAARRIFSCVVHLSRINLV
jgi:hypothetical protein